MHTQIEIVGCGLEVGEGEVFPPRIRIENVIIITLCLGYETWSNGHYFSHAAASPH